MKIVQFINQLGNGGAERFVVDLSNELCSRGHAVTILVLRDCNDQKFSFNTQFISDSVRLISLASRPGFRISDIKRVRQTILELNPDIFHCHLNVLPYLGISPFLSRKVKFFHTIHNLPHFENPNPIMRLISRLYYSTSVIPISISQQCHKEFKEYYWLHNDVIIENGRSMPEKTSAFSDVVSECKYFERPIFLHVARFAYEKNQDTLFKAFAILKEQKYPGTLLVIGSGYEDVNVDNPNIHILGQKKNVSDYLHIADVFCLSSIFEGMPISLIEAMACGIVPVCTKVGGIPDMIKDGYSGILSEGSDPETFSKALIRYYENKVRKQNILEIYDTRFSITNCAQNHLLEYNRSIQEG